MSEQNNNENASYQIVFVYEVQENMDKLEGHGAYQTIAFVTDETLARQMARANPRNPGKVLKKTAIFVSDGCYYLLADPSPIHIETSAEDAEKAMAMAKLTPQERQLLGLQ
jgi:hypothetical protein